MERIETKVYIARDGTVLDKVQSGVFQRSCGVDYLIAYIEESVEELAETAIKVNFLRPDGVRPKSRAMTLQSADPTEYNGRIFYAYWYQMNDYQLERMGALVTSLTIKRTDVVLNTGTFTIDIGLSVQENPDDAIVDENELEQQAIKNAEQDLAIKIAQDTVKQSVVIAQAAQSQAESASQKATEANQAAQQASQSASEASKKAIKASEDAQDAKRYVDEYTQAAEVKIEQATSDIENLKVSLANDVASANNNANTAKLTASLANTIATQAKEDSAKAAQDSADAKATAQQASYVATNAKTESESAIEKVTELEKQIVENQGTSVYVAQSAVSRLDFTSDPQGQLDELRAADIDVIYPAQVEGSTVNISNTNSGFVDSIHLLGRTTESGSVVSPITIVTRNKNLLGIKKEPVKIIDDRYDTQSIYDATVADVLKVGGNLALHAPTYGYEADVISGAEYTFSAELKFHFTSSAANASVSFMAYIYDFTNGVKAANEWTDAIQVISRAIIAPDGGWSAGTVNYGNLTQSIKIPNNCDKIGITFTCNWGTAGKNLHSCSLTHPQLEFGKDTAYERYIEIDNSVNVRDKRGNLHVLRTRGDVRDEAYFDSVKKPILIQRISDAGDVLASPISVELDYESMKNLQAIPTADKVTNLHSNAVMGVKELQLTGVHKSVVLKNSSGEPLDVHTSSEMVLRPNGESVELALENKADQSEIERVVKKEDYLYSGNSFGNNKVLIDRISDTFWAANWRTPVVATLHMKEVGGITYPRSAAGDYPFEDSPIVRTLTITEMNTMFDRYEGTRFTVPAGQYLKLSIGALQTLTGVFPYGQFSVQYYNNAHSESSTFRYRFVQSGTWSNANGSPYEHNGVVSYDYYTNWNYVNAMDIIVIAPDNQTCEIQEMEMLGLRTDLPNLPYVSKNANNDIYASFTFKNASGQIKASIKNGDGSADFYRLTENGERVYSPANPPSIRYLSTQTQLTQTVPLLGNIYWSDDLALKNVTGGRLIIEADSRAMEVPLTIKRGSDSILDTYATYTAFVTQSGNPPQATEFRLNAAATAMVGDTSVTVTCYANMEKSLDGVNYSSVDITRITAELNYIEID